MIAKLTGLLDAIGDGFVVLDVNGVGYLVFCSSKTMSELPAIGQRVSLLTEMQVREDSVKLFGFADVREKNWFLTLTTVQGVGAKVALAILSVLNTDELAVAVYAADAKALTKAAGVGSKLAVRIVTELKGKTIAAPDVFAEPAVGESFAQPKASAATTDAMSALINLGYQRMDAAAAVNKAVKNLGAEADFAALVREALKEFDK